MNFFIMYNHKRNMHSSRGDAAQSAHGKNNKSTVIKSAIGVAQPTPKDSSLKKQKASRKINPLYTVIRKYKNVFASYDEQCQNTDTKIVALNIAIGMSRDLYPDRFRFWQDLRDEANILLDSKRFEATCVKWNLRPQAVAEHIVVEGKATLNRVLKNGLEAYGEKARMFKDPLYIDTRGLYAEPTHE
jgi:hypothetical protein